MNKIYLGLGSNIGDRTANLELAAALVKEKIGGVVKASAIYQTAAWGLENQADFYNQVLCINTKLEPLDLLEHCQWIEQKLGRIRKENWGPRRIDIDILFFNNEIIQHETLTIPHPYMQDRNFVLLPFCEIAPEWLHPVFSKTMRLLLEECSDELAVQQLELSKNPK